MLTSLRVDGFRCLDTLRVDGLKRVNLLVGTNGSGKTSLIDWLRNHSEGRTVASTTEPGHSGSVDYARWLHAGPDGRSRVSAMLESVADAVTRLDSRDRIEGLVTDDDRLVASYADGRTIPFVDAPQGIVQAVRSVLAVTAARGGLALLDDFGNALHWLIQPVVWRALFDTARDLDVQVFAATHSIDCVHAFSDVVADDGDGLLLRLGRSVRASERGRPIATVYGGDECRIVVARILEVR